MVKRGGRTPKFGRLEADVDAVLRSRGLEMSTAPEKLLERAKRGGLFAADGSHHRKGEKTIRRNIRKFKAAAKAKKTTKSRKPARTKQLRAARRA